jgi:hypothetical protein
MERNGESTKPVASFTLLDVSAVIQKMQECHLKWRMAESKRDRDEFLRQAHAWLQHKVEQTKP